MTKRDQLKTDRERRRGEEGRRGLGKGGRDLVRTCVLKSENPVCASHQPSSRCLYNSNSPASNTESSRHFKILFFTKIETLKNSLSPLPSVLPPPIPPAELVGDRSERAAFPMTMDLSTGAKVGNEVANDVIQEGKSILVTFRLNYEPVRFFPLNPLI